MCSVLKDEFRLTNVWLNYNKPEAFYKSQWRFPWPVFILYRLTTAGYAIFAFTYLIVKRENHKSKEHNVMAYLTTWTYLVLTLYMIHTVTIAIYCHYRTKSTSYSIVAITKIKTISTSDDYCFTNPEFCYDVCKSEIKTSFENERNQLQINSGRFDMKSDKTETLHVQDPAIMENNLAWYLKLSWLLWNIASVDAILVTAIYFGALYNNLQEERGHPGLDLNNLNVHALNTVFVVADVAIGAKPVRLLHVIYPLMFSLVFIVFSLIYWCYDHTNVLYKGVLDWNNAAFTTGVVIVVGLVILPFIQTCHFVLYRLRLFIYRKIYNNDY